MILSPRVDHAHRSKLRRQVHGLDYRTEQSNATYLEMLQVIILHQLSAIRCLAQAILHTSVDYLPKG